MNVNTKHEWVNLNFSQILTKRRLNLKLQKMGVGGGGLVGGNWELGTKVCLRDCFAQSNNAVYLSL